MSVNRRISQTTSLPNSPRHTEPSTTSGHPNQPCRHAATATGSLPVPGPLPGRRQTVPGAAALRPAPSQDRPRDRVDAGGSRLRLRALHVMGHGSSRIARALGVRQTTISQLVRGGATISPRLRDAITDLYDAWWDKRAPERTRGERAAALAARRRAIAGNWCAAAALDDDLLDTPGYRPRYGWKAATGTGVAPDIRPAARHDRRKKGA
jgi:transcriptional regulator with XRE-family HTH domain